MKFLVAGLGSIGIRHLNNLRALGYSDILAYRTKKSQMPNIDDFSSLPTFFDLDEALAQNPDCVIVSNPTAYHLPVALKAAKAGCHLFLEKPVSHTLEGVNELNAVVDEKKLVTFVAYQFRFHPLFQLLKDKIKDRVLGRVSSALVDWGEYLPDWHPWEDYRKGYSARKDLGGGALLTFIHPVDLLYDLFGKITFSAGIKQEGPLLGIDADECSDLIFRFESNVSATVHVDYLQKPPVKNLKIIVEKGRFLLDLGNNVLSVTDFNGETKDFFAPQDFERNTMFISEMKHFTDCIKDKKPSIASLQQGIDVLQSLLTATQNGK